MTIADWERKAAGLTTPDMEKIISAIETLKEWPAFAQEFKDTGIFTLGIIVFAVMDERIRKEG